MIRLDVTAELSRISTTQAIIKAVPRLADQNMKKMLRAGDIRLNGSRIKKDYETVQGDIIEIYLPEYMRPRDELEIVYEDRNLLIANKNPGTPVHSADNTLNLLSIVRRYMIDEGEFLEEAGYVPFAVENLDVNTGGLTLFAKNVDAYDYALTSIRERRIRRIYQAIVYGCPERREGEFKHFYLRDAHRERVSRNGMQGAVAMYTRYRVLRTSGAYSLLEVEPVTAIPNQERIHMLAAGYPIVGDPVYGDFRLNKKTGIRYQALWSTEIGFAVGRNNMFEYLNGRCVRTEDTRFPIVNLDGPRV